MMELKVCALVVTLISSVIANPYGYGIKGGAGASAKAVAGAAASTFIGDVPVPVPFGNGFSGTFTKSSASSSSSSSASSSSSSSSFTYNGYGPGGVSSPGSSGNIGCTTGLCQNSEAKDLSGNLGEAGSSTGVQGYNIANAAAAAGSVSGANCQGSTCSPNSEKCLSGHCLTNPQLGTLPSIHSANDKCTSGQCGTTSNAGSSIPQYDNLDDIHVIGHTSYSAYDSNDQTSHDHKATDDSVSSNCNGGSCGTTLSLNSQPISAHRSTTQPGQQSPASPYEASKRYNIPSIHLGTPKQDTTCENGNCDTEYSRPSYDNSLSSYNVPIHGAYDSNKLKPQCQDEKCNSPQKGSFSTTTDSLTTNYLNSQDSHSTKGSYYPGSPSCTAPNCGSVPSGHIGDKPFTASSTDDQIGLTSPNPGSIKCNSPNCNPHYAVSPNASIVQPGQSHYTLPIDKVLTPTQKLPVYTSGFGAPAGVLSVNPSNTHSSTTLQKEPTYGSASTGCNSPNCLGQAPSPNIHEQPTFGDNKPNEDTKVPIYSGGFGAPVGLLKPYDIPAPGISNPIQYVSPIHTTPPSVTKGCKTDNCFGSSNIAGTTSTSNTQSGSYDIHKEYENGNVYTGGFGGPTGMLKPNELDVKVTTKPEQSTTPSFNNQSPVPSTAICKAPNCIGNTATAGTVSGLSVQSGADGVSKPNVVIDSSKDLPYTGGFGGPAGLLKPNEFDLSHNSHNYYPSHSVTSQNKIPTYINSAGCSTPNCYPHTIGTPLVTNTQLPSISCSGSNCGSVLPGYKSGKPSTADNQFGFLLPNSGPTKCNSPSCNQHYIVSGPTVSNVQPGQTNYALPSDKVSTSPHPSTTLHKNPIYGIGSKGCNSPSCFGQPSLPGGIEQPTFNEDKPDEGAKLPTYSGGFGAPIGLHKPNEYDVTGSGISKPIESVSPTRYTPSPVTTGCKTGNCFGPSNNAGATSTSTTQSGSYGIHKENEGENIYSGGYGEPKGLLIPNKSAGCKTSNCNENTATDGPVAGADTQSGLNGMIKPSISIDSDSELPPYTGGFGGPAGLLKPNVFEASHIARNQYPHDSDKSPNKSPTNTNSAGCSTPNCSTHNVVSVTNIVTNTQPPFAVTKPITSPQVGYTSNYGRPVGVTYPSPIAVAPITLSTALPLIPTGTYNSGCNTPDCDTYPASEKSTEKAPFGSTAVNNLQGDSKISDSQHDSDLDVPTISIKPSAHIHTSTSTISGSTSCQSPDCINVGSTITGSNTQVGSYAGSKQYLPTYTSGFGAPTGLLNPYDKPISAGSLKPDENTKSPGPTKSSGCTSDYCNPNPTSSSSSHNVATSLGGTHASASSSASASAVAYSGGYGGPPGVLKPYDDDKAYVEQNYGKSNINSPYEKKPGSFSTGTTSQIRGQTNFGVLAGSAAGTYSGSGASYDADLYGYSHHGPHGNDDKTASPCGGGCGGYQGSLTGSGNSAAAIAKSLSSSGSFGLGGNFASSASSAHSLAGSYTKGGYGKR